MKKTLLPPTVIKGGFLNEESVLTHLPKRYEDFHFTPLKSSYQEKERVVFKGKIIKGSLRLTRFYKRNLVSFSFEREDGCIFHVEAWNRDYLLHQKEEMEMLLTGFYERKRKSIRLENLIKVPMKGESLLKGIYHLPECISQATFRQTVKGIFEKKGEEICDVIPEKYRLKYRLLHRKDALWYAHFPKNKEEVHQALRTLKYEEALRFECANELIKGENFRLQKENLREMDKEKIASFIKNLPYSLLEDQRQAFREIYRDLEKKGVMYRLLQGDVGTGKTLVAALACFANSTRRAQSALMAPTESLARQHYRTFQELFANTPLKIALLTGSTPLTEKREILTDLYAGEIDILIGTHSLFSKSVRYLNLGLVIIDEQHKFGVNQRSSLLGKGEHSDLLLMSATPIPRTLSLALFGNMDISTLHEFPHGIRKVTTKIFSPDDPTILETVLSMLDEKRQIYIVLPHIEGESALISVKKLYEQFQKLFPSECILLHGKMSQEEKNEAENCFREGKKHILIATSLVEVGLDVPNAGLMIIYHASSFSLSSIHQLRGRVGRDGKEAYCYLVDEGSKEGEKLKILEKNNDGFAISEADLSLRGPGDFIGVRQAGLPEFNYCNVVNDVKIFDCALEDAKEILNDNSYKDSLLLEEAKEDSMGHFLS